MTTILTQGTQTGEWLLSEATSVRSRDKATVTIAGNVALPSGTVLGKVTASGKYVAQASGASDGSQNAAAILYTSLSGAVNGDLPATIFSRDCEVIGNALNGGTPPNAAAIAALAAVGILVRF